MSEREAIAPYKLDKEASMYSTYWVNIETGRLFHCVHPNQTPRDENWMQIEKEQWDLLKLVADFAMGGRYSTTVTPSSPV